MNRKSVRLVALVAAFGLAACGESTAVHDELNVEEAAELGSAVLFATFDNTATAPQAPAAVSGPAAAPFSLSFNWDFTAECPLGGGVGIDAAVDVEGDDAVPEAGSVDYVMTQVHDGCVVEGDEGRIFTLDGSPSVTVTLTAVNDGQGQVTWSGSLVGAVAWETDGRSGVCGLELEFSGGANTDTGAAEFELGGSVCNTAIEHSGQLG